MSTTRTPSDKAREQSRERSRRYRERHPERIAAYHRKRNYGITKGQWDELFVSQGSRCAVCRTPDEPVRGWHTDHCHETGKVRGILCGCCNFLLGHAKDNTDTLASAIAYLKAHNGNG